MCVCVKISRVSWCERNWRSRWTAEKEAKKTKKTSEGKKPQTREEKIHAERDNILLIPSLLLIRRRRRRRMYTKKIRAASHVVILLL